MAIPKVLGIETEYGILRRGPSESNPIAASSLLINAYVTDLARRGQSGGVDTRVSWDFEDESPGIDARGFAVEGAMPPEVETHLVNAVLTNGARYYVDHAHPEYSSPECTSATEIVRWDRAGDEILIRSMAAAKAMLPDGEELVVHKNNSDGKGNSYGCHENYLVDRAVPFGRIVNGLTPHLITRQIYTGAGKVGTELAGLTSDDVPFQLTQRADFFEEEVGLETTLKRPIINTRDEPHADAQKYRRLHVIIGDANLSETATFLKVGVTALVLCMIDDGELPSDLRIVDPVRALRAVSHDVTCSKPLMLERGGTATALELQWELFENAKKYADRHGLEALGADGSGDEVLAEWESVLECFETDLGALADRVDWIAKHRLIDGYRERHSLEWDDPKLAALGLQFHDLRPGKSLHARLGMIRRTSDDEVALAVTEPPETTRAYFRGKCLQRWSDSIVAANWDSLVFDIGSDPLRRVPMMEPGRGTKAHVGTLVEGCETASELLDQLGA